MRRLLVLMPLWALVGMGCGGTSRTCTVTKDAASGVATITCPDGSAVDVAPGAPGVESLVKLDEESAGANCPIGGTRVQSGRDTNGNTVLDADEVLEARYLCTPAVDAGTSPCTTLEGTYTVTNTLDWQNLVNSGCQVLSGDLVISAPGVVTLKPGAPLTSIQGNLVVMDNPTLENLAFPGLTSVGGVLQVSGIARLASVELPMLATVGGRLVISNNAALTALSLPELTTVAGRIDLTDNPLLASFTLPKVTGVNGKSSVGCADAFPYHDDIRGLAVCVKRGACAAGHRDNGLGTCVTAGCAAGHHDVGGRCLADAVAVTGGSSSSPDFSYAGVGAVVSNFQLDRTEVTVAQYDLCIAGGGCSSPGHVGSCNWGATGKETHPINCVDWLQAKAFCTWAGKRLPTEVEWHWAASKGGTITYPWGEAAPDDTRAQWSGSSPKTGTAQVGTHPAGATAGGVQDLAGNASEWTSSDYAPGSLDKTVRGGAWSLDQELGLRAAFRTNRALGSRYGDIGFRCAQ